MKISNDILLKTLQNRTPEQVIDDNFKRIEEICEFNSDLRKIIFLEDWNRKVREKNDKRTFETVV